MFHPDYKGTETFQNVWKPVTNETGSLPKRNENLCHNIPITSMWEQVKIWTWMCHSLKMLRQNLSWKRWNKMQCVGQHRREATNVVKELSLYVFLLCVVKWYLILGEVEALMSVKRNTAGCDATLMKVCGTYCWGYYFHSISVAKRKAGKLKNIFYYFIMIWRERNSRNEIACLVCFLWLYRAVGRFVYEFLYAMEGRGA